MANVAYLAMTTVACVGSFRCHARGVSQASVQARAFLIGERLNSVGVNSDLRATMG